MNEELTEYWIISQQFLNKFLDIYDCLIEEAGKHVKFNYYKIREHNLKKICIAHFMKDDNREMIRRVIEERLPPKLIFQGPPRSDETPTGDFDENCETIIGPDRFKKMHNLYLKIKQFVEQPEIDRNVNEASNLYDNIYNPLFTYLS